MFLSEFGTVPSTGIASGGSIRLEPTNDVPVSVSCVDTRSHQPAMQYSDLRRLQRFPTGRTVGCAT